jgi:hypothetical protein
VNGVEPRVRVRAFDLESRDGDLDRVVGDGEDDGSFRLDVVEAREVLAPSSTT